MRAGPIPARDIEALQLLTHHPIWGERVLGMLNEALYTGKLPALVERGLTVLLPKGGARPTRTNKKTHHAQQCSAQGPGPAAPPARQPVLPPPPHLPLGRTHCHPP